MCIRDSAKTRPHKRYIKGMITYIRSKWPGLMATLGYALTGGALGLYVSVIGNYIVDLILFSVL